MKVTPDIVCHEFVGVNAKVVRCSHRGTVGLSGRVVDETRNMFTILYEGKKKMVAKASSVFHFKFSDGTVVEIDGKLLTGRPEDRLKKSIRRLW